MAESLLQRLADAPGEPTAPNPVERAVMHALYLLSLLLVAGGGAAAFRLVRPDLRVLLAFAGLLAASWSYLLWLVAARRPPMAVWFATHPNWLARTYTVLLLVAAVLGGCFLVVLLFVAAAPQVAYLLYALFVLPGLAGLWFVYRIFRGYVALLRHRPVGFVPWPSPRSDLDPRP